MDPKQEQDWTDQRSFDLFAIFDRPWKFSFVSTVLSVIITYFISYAVAGSVGTTPILIAVACALPLSYISAHIFLNYKQKIDEQNARLHQLTAELQEANDLLQMSNAELDVYAHTVAHDLKNPMATIIGAGEMLLETYENLGAPQREQLLRLQVRTSKRLVGFINELLLLSSVREVAQVEMKPLDMATIVIGAQERLQQAIVTHEAEIVVPEAWPLAQGHAPWVEAVWTNYLSNAIKYGGRPPHITVGAKLGANGQVRFWVRDNGSGLTAVEREQIFVPFERLQQSGQIEGHGLGLSIVHRIIERLGGEVGVEKPETGPGSVFFFTLPQV